MTAGLSPNVRGMLALMSASAIFAVSDTFLKLTTQTWPVSQVMMVRGAVAIAIAFASMLAQRQLSALTLLMNPLVLIRSALEGLLALLFILALARLPLADLTAMLMVAPLLITAFAALLFNEQVGWRRWSAIAAGFAGMLLVVQPGNPMQGEGYAGAAVLGVACAFLAAARDLVTKRIRQDIPNVLIMLATTIGAFLAGGALSLVETWQPFTARPVALLVIAAFLVTAANFLLIVSSRGVDLSVVAPFRYTAVIFAISLGIFVFGDAPNTVSLCGMGIIVASGVYLMHRERVRRLQRDAAMQLPS